MNVSDEILSIDTPENVNFGYSLAGLGSRFLAALVDSTLIVLAQVIILIPTFYFIARSEPDDRAMTWIVSLLSLLGFVFFWGYYIAFELTWNGQSPGKRMVGIRVIRRDGTPVTLTEVLIRNLVRAVDFLPAFYGIGTVIMFADSLARRLGDMAAGTLVVHDSGPVSLETLTPAKVMPLNAPPEDPALSDFPLNRLSNADLQLLEDYLTRRFNLSNREEISKQVLRRLYARAGMPEHPLPENPDLALLAIFNSLRSKNNE
jgi:uncharacterized RDD family membrane protein YckC